MEQTAPQGYIKRNRPETGVGDRWRPAQYAWDTVYIRDEFWPRVTVVNGTITAAGCPALLTLTEAETRGRNGLHRAILYIIVQIDDVLKTGDGGTGSRGETGPAGPLRPEGGQG